MLLILNLILTVPVDDFDWTRHLMEGIQYQTYDSDSGSEVSSHSSVHLLHVTRFHGDDDLSLEFF